MKRAGITAAKNNLSALLERVKPGETVVIEVRGVPIATLEPLTGSRERADLGPVERLVHQGILRRARGSVPKEVLALHGAEGLTDEVVLATLSRPARRSG